MDPTVTVVTIGDAGVGKTAIMMAATAGDFCHEYIRTHCDQYARNVIVDGSAMNVRLWDIGADSSLDELRDQCLQQAINDSRSGNTTLVVALCFDVCNHASLMSFHTRYRSLIESTIRQGALVIAVGCKSDLLPERTRVKLYHRYCPLPSALLPLIHSYLYWPHLPGGPDHKRTCATGTDISYDEIQRTLIAVGCQQYVECSARVHHWHTKIMERTSNPTLSLPSHHSSSGSLYGSDVACVAHSSVHRVVKQAVRLVRLKRGYVPSISTVSSSLSTMSMSVSSPHSIHTNHGITHEHKMVATLDDNDDFEVDTSGCSGTAFHQRQYVINNTSTTIDDITGDTLIHGHHTNSLAVRSFADTRRALRAQRGVVHAVNIHGAEALQFPSLDDDG